MERRYLTRNTWIFCAFILFNGVINVMDYFLREDYFLVTALFVLSLGIYMGLIVFWIISVNTRLLPSRERLYILISAALMTFYLILRAVKYRIIPDETAASRMLWYLYYVPMIIIPAMFFLCSLRISGRNERIVRIIERICIMISCILAALVLINEFHYLAFLPTVDPGAAWGNTHTYSYGPLFYTAYFWMGLMMLSGIALLIYGAGRRRDLKKAIPPVIFLLMIPVIINLSEYCKTFLDVPYQVPEIFIFCMIGCYEVCIRERLIPGNESYPRLFEIMDYPAIITDRRLDPIYESSGKIGCSKETLKSSIGSSTELEDNRIVSGMEIRGGYVFYEEDLSEIRSVNELLEEANETIGLENRLIEYENQQKEEKAKLDARNTVYRRASEEVYPIQRKADDIIKDSVPGTESFRLDIARTGVLNAFIKRKSNFVLSYEKDQMISSRELYLAIDEMVRFLNYCGILSSVENNAEGSTFSYDETVKAYDTFEELTEELLPVSKRLLISISSRGLTLITDYMGVDPTIRTELPYTVMEADGLTYITVAISEGGGES